MTTDTTEDKTQKELLREFKALIKLQAEGQVGNKAKLKSDAQELELKMKDHPGKHMYWVVKKYGLSFNIEEQRQEGKRHNRIHQLAYGFVRGMSYEAMENKTKRDEPEWIVDRRAKHVYAIYSAHFAADNRIQKLTEEDIRRALHRGNNGN